MDAAQGSGSGGGGLHLAQAAAVEADLTNCGAVVDSLDRHLRLWSEGHYCSCEAGEVQQWLAEAARQMGELYAAAARLQAAGLFAPAAELMGKIAVAVQMTDTVRGELAGTGATGPAATQELVVDVGHGPCHVRVTDIPAGHTGDQCGRCGAFADGRPDQNGRHFCHECWFVSGCEQRTQNAAAAIAAHPVVIFGGDDTKPKYRELLLQPTGTWANERPVWSTPNGGGMHLYAMQDGTWCLNTSLQPDTTCHIAHTDTAELTGRVTWQLSRGIRATPDSSSESVLMVVTGAEADSCAAQAEAAAAVIATHPIVVCGGDGYVKKKYRDILLLPTDKNANGRPVWSTEGGGLHLYRMADGDWCLNQTFQPDERFAMAHIRDSFSASPPAGEALWQVGRDLCDLEKLGAGADTHWATGALVLVTGAEAAAHSAMHESQVLALRTHLSECLALVEDELKAGTNFTAELLEQYIAMQVAKISSVVFCVSAAARAAITLEFLRIGWDVETNAAAVGTSVAPDGVLSVVRLLRAVGRHLDLQDALAECQSSEAAVTEQGIAPVAITRLYHGTSFAAAISIQKSGFRVDLSGTNCGARLGNGVYCSTTLQKALHYASGHPGQGIIFMLDVELGRCKVLDSSDPLTCSWNTHGYDSAFSPKSSNGCDDVRILLLFVLHGFATAN